MQEVNQDVEGGKEGKEGKERQRKPKTQHTNTHRLQSFKNFYLFPKNPHEL